MSKRELKVISGDQLPEMDRDAMARMMVRFARHLAARRSTRAVAVPPEPDEKVNQ